MSKQTVIRTQTKPSNYKWTEESYRRLENLLDEGWVVKMVNPIGDELEYILEK